MLQRFAFLLLLCILLIEETLRKREIANSLFRFHAFRWKYLNISTSITRITRPKEEPSARIPSEGGSDFPSTRISSSIIDNINYPPRIIFRLRIIRAISGENRYENCIPTIDKVNTLVSFFRELPIMDPDNTSIRRLFPIQRSRSTVSLSFTFVSLLLDKNYIV